MPTSSLNLTLNVVISLLTVYWLLTCTSCSQMNFVRSGRGLTEVPTCLHENTIELDLSNNSIKIVDRDDFRKLKKVKIIDMSYNKIENVHADAFEHVGDLEILNLSHNCIFNLSPNIFHSNKKLTKVHLNNNKLEVTRKFCWKEHILESPSVTHLDVSFCNIACISSETFIGLPNLEILNMNGNPLTQFDVEFIRPHKNLKIIHMQLFNTSTFEKFCNHLINHTKLTLSPPCPSESTTRLTDREEADLKILTAGTIMCACAFIVTVIMYLLITRLKTRISNAVDTKERDSENTTQQRRLPQPAEPNEGYEIPTSPRYGWFSSIYHNRQVKRKTGYTSVPLENIGDVSGSAVSDKGGDLTGTNPGSLHSLSCTTVYQEGTLYPKPSQVDSHPESNVDKYSTVLEATETSSVPKIPQLPKQCQSSHIRTTFNAEVLSESPPRSNQMIGSGSPVRRSKHQNMSLSPVSPQPICVFEEPHVHDTKACVNGSEIVFVSSTFIEIEKNSRSTVQIRSTTDDTKQILTEPTVPLVPPRSFESNKKIK